MKKFKEMKENNKGFSLVELIVVIAIMVVLVAVLGSTILGYVEKSKYSKDIQALDSVKTAVTTYVAEGGADTTEVNLDALIALDTKGTIKSVLAEVFSFSTGADGKTATAADFNNSSTAFSTVTSATVKVIINNGAVSIYVPSGDSDFDAYKAGTATFSTSSGSGSSTTTP